MMMIAAIPTSEAIIMVICLIVTLVYGSIIEIRRDNELKELDEYHKATRIRLDRYIKELDDALNTLRTSKNTESKSKDC